MNPPRLIMVLCLCGMSSSVVAEPKPSHITVATWNLEWFFDHDSSDQDGNVPVSKAAPSAAAFQWKLNGVAQAIADMNPTIIGLQEVEDRDIVEELAKKLRDQHSIDYHICFVQGLDDYTEQDVAILSQAEPVACGRKHTPKSVLKNKTLYKDLTKHVTAEFSWGKWSKEEYLMVIVVHLTSGGGAPQRKRQGAVVRHWIEPLIEYEENVIVLGDFNSGKQFGSATTKDSGVGVIRGLKTEAEEDNLYDVHNDLPEENYATHLDGEHYDRILISRALTADYDYKDLVFDSVACRTDLVIRGSGKDEKHGDEFWDIAAVERDLSDHYPLIATFKFVN